MTTNKVLIRGRGADATEAAARSRLKHFGSVDFRGLSAGEVSRIDIDFKRRTSDVAMAVKISLYSEGFACQERNRRASLPTLRAIRQILDGMVTKAFRTRLRTGQRQVAPDRFPNTHAAAINWRPPSPELPVRPGGTDSLQERLLAVVEAMQSTLQRTDRLIAHLDQDVVPDLVPTLRDARQTLEHQPQALLT